MVLAELHDAELLAADAIGEVIEHWGFRKALGRVWTILYLGEDPRSAADLAERLSMSAGAVSTTLGELQRWGRGAPGVAFPASARSSSRRRRTSGR